MMMIKTKRPWQKKIKNLKKTLEQDEKYVYNFVVKYQVEEESKTEWYKLKSVTTEYSMQQRLFVPLSVLNLPNARE